jgi:hypothetical protein
MRAQDIDRNLVGDFTFPRAVLAFETESMRAVAPHFARLNAGPVQFLVDPNSRFQVFRRARAQVGRTSFDYFQIECSAGHKIVSMRPHESEYFLFVRFAAASRWCRGVIVSMSSPGRSRSWARREATPRSAGTASPSCW